MGKGAGSKAEQEVVEYRLSIHFGICTALDGIKKITIGDRVAWEGNAVAAGPININAPNLFGGNKKEGGCVGSAYYLPGGPAQVMPNDLAGRFGLTSENCPAFRGISTIFFVGSQATNGVGLGGALRGGFYWTANSPFIQPAAIEGWRAPKGLDPAKAMIGPDANPIHIIYECLTDTDWGMGAALYQFNTALWEAQAVKLFDEQFGLTLFWTQQASIESFVNEVLDHIQATLFVNPRTGLLEIKLLRDDYDIETLREINPGNAKMVGFQRKMWGETANEIVVSWTNPVTEKEESVSAQDLGNIAAQGGTISDSRNYYGARNGDLGARLAARDCRTSSAPLALVEVLLDRSGWDTLPGEVLKVTWPVKNLDRVIMRVMKVSYGKTGDPDIKVSLLEDVFSLIKPPSQIPPPTGWEGVNEVPAPMEFATVFTLPAFLAARELRTNVANLSYPEVLAGVLTHQPGNDTISYDMYAESPLANGEIVWASAGAKSILGRVEMLTPLYPEAVSLVAGLPLIEMGRGPVVGGLAFIGDGTDLNTEIAMMRSVDAGGTWTLDRGVLDTVPKAWPIETPVWFAPLSALLADDDQTRSVGETAEYKLLTRTSLGLLDVNTAPIHSGVMSGRPHLPLRPANAKVNAVGYGEVDAAATTELVLTWATRNRLFEDGQVILWTDGGVTGEFGQETLVTVYRENGTEWFQIRGLWEHLTYTIPVAWVQEEQKVFIRFSAERRGLSSLQNYGLWIKNIPQIVDPAPPPASPIIVAPPPAEPEPDPDPTPDPLPPADPASPGIPGGGGGPGEWRQINPIP